MTGVKGSGAPPTHREAAVRMRPEQFPRCAAAATVRAACTGLVEDLHSRWDLPSVYLLLDGRLRCQASRGYFQVSDGFTDATGVIGRVIATGEAVVLHDVRDDPSFIAAIPGLRAEVCVPVLAHGVIVGAVNLESRTSLDDRSIADIRQAAAFLGDRLQELGGLPATSVAERLSRIAVTLASQTDAAQVQIHATEGALAVSDLSTAAIATLDASGTWSVTQTIGPLAEVLRRWGDDVLRILGGWVWAATSSYFPDGEDVPPGYEFLGQEIRALSVQPLVVAGVVTGLLLTADAQPHAHDPVLTTTMELLAAQTAATLAMVRTLEHLEHQASQDSLTGLANRRRLLEELDDDVLDQQPDGPSSALVLLDLDGFKGVNDQYGHVTGDAVLSAVARRLEASARPGDVVCRLGGDEFAVLVRGLPSGIDAEAVGERFVSAVNQVTDGSGHPPVAASAGVRVVAGPSASTVLVDADVALNAAKRLGRGQCVVWNPALRAAGLDEDALVDDLRQALVDNDLTLVYQPVVDIRTLRVLGLEALCRWEHPDRGPVPPSVFVAAAERAGMVRELTHWVLRTAFDAATRWGPAPDGSQVNIALNISAAQLADDLVVHDVADALRTAGLPASRVVLEVTETAEVVDLACAKRTLESLAALGITLALDDFGTGFSSLTHAQALPFDILKIDRSFTAAAALGDRQALATIAAVCALAARLEVDVVAEGVEDQAQLAELTALGCSHAQGYALARPLPTSVVQDALAHQGPHGWVLARVRGHGLIALPG
jgi:diguanylate cyclase (GGDEF)-like protein